MNIRLAWRTTALVALASIGLAGSAMANDKVVKIGVLNDMSSLYADIGGPNSVVAVQMAVEDSGLTAKGWKIDVISGDHQNKPDVGVNIARQWIDEQKVDAIADTPNSGVALAVSNVVKEKNAVLLNSGAASADLTGPAVEAVVITCTGSPEPAGKYLASTFCAEMEGGVPRNAWAVVSVPNLNPIIPAAPAPSRIAVTTHTIRGRRLMLRPTRDQKPRLVGSGVP